MTTREAVETVVIAAVLCGEIERGREGELQAYIFRVVDLMECGLTILNGHAVRAQELLSDNERSGGNSGDSSAS